MYIETGKKVSDKFAQFYEYSFMNILRKLQIGKIFHLTVA